jgi:S1-C subfamily serine protease
MVDSNFFVQKSALDAAHLNKTDMHSLQGDPQFINANVGDFKVAPTSKALTIGFKNFSMSEFGVVSNYLKQRAAKPKITPVRTLEQTKTGAISEWLGSNIKNVETLGEQSASGLPDKNGVLIVSVKAASITEKNGLVPGDVIRRINGKKVATVAEMLNALQAIAWQGGAQVNIWHNQESKDLQIRLK